MMENLLSGLAIIGDGYIWSEGEPRLMNEGELAQLAADIPAEVVQGDYNLRLKMFLGANPKAYMPIDLDKDSQASVGDLVNLRKVKIGRMYRACDPNTKIYRARVSLDAII